MRLELIRPALILLLHIGLLFAFSWFYFRRYQMTRPPLGVLDISDIAIMVGSILVIPYLYLYLPRWMVVALLLLGMSSAIYFVLEPLVTSRLLPLAISFALLLLELGMAWAWGTESLAFVIINNLILLLVAISVTVLWAQSGMKARDVAMLAAALALYDYVYTGALPFTSDLFARLSGLPFIPALAWPVENYPITNTPTGNTATFLSIGLGDLLLLTLFPLVLGKAYSHLAGFVAMFIGGSTIATIFCLAILEWLGGSVPLMVILGPLIVLQYLYWRWHIGSERTTLQYRRTNLSLRRAKAVTLTHKP